MKNQKEYFNKIMEIFKDLKEDHPTIEISKHYLLSTDNCSYPITDKELFNALEKYKSELDMNTLSDEDMLKIINNPENLFEEVDYDEDLDTELE